MGPELSEVSSPLGIIEPQFYTFEGITLESGQYLGPITVAYQTYGQLNPAQDNVILVCHTLSGNAHIAGISAEEGSTVIGDVEERPIIHGEAVVASHILAELAEHRESFEARKRCRAVGVTERQNMKCSHGHSPVENSQFLIGQI